jgi:signal transduction protein with GAF and PtsI domain
MDHAVLAQLASELQARRLGEASSERLVAGVPASGTAADHVRAWRRALGFRFRGDLAKACAEPRVTEVQSTHRKLGVRTALGDQRC